MEEMIKLWKKAEISYAVFTFDCGYDSMNDTSIAFYDKNRKEIKTKSKELETLSEYFDDEVYNHIDFYDASDGYYIGERGTVDIELDDEDEDEEYFTYSKSAESMFSNHVSDTLPVKITKEQAEFLKEYVSDMSGGASGEETNYKKDFVLTEEHEKMIEELHRLFYEKADEWASCYDDEEDVEYEIEEIEIKNENDTFLIEIKVSCHYVSYGEAYD